jgi:hypothetical protein
MKNFSYYSFIISFVWFGFVTAISFLEAPVKFTAPSLTLPVGLDVGSHVFAALNKVEWFFAIISSVFILSGFTSKKITTFFIIIILILSIQTFWLLPALEERVLIYLSGNIPQDSNLHIFYIIAEMIKIISLFFLGLIQIENFRNMLLLGRADEKT